MISSFPTSTYDPGATSPQGLAFDDYDGTLWLTDNASDSIYNVTTTGQLISSFPSSTFDPNATNLQDISSPPNSLGVLWVSARNTSTIYEITTSGNLLGSIFTAPLGVNDPTGVLLDLGSTPTSSFCTAKTTLSCGPARISSVGISSASASSGFTINAAPTRGCRRGYLFYSDQPIQSGKPFGGAGDGVLCIQVPLKEAGLIDAGGTPGGCDGVFSIDVNAFARSKFFSSGCSGAQGLTKPAAFLSTPGVTVITQMFGRDTATTGRLVSAGLGFVVGP